MTIIGKLKVLFQLERAAKAVQDAMKTKDSTKIIAAVTVALAGILQVDAVHTLVVAFLQNHPIVAAIVGAIGTLTALFHVPVKDATKAAAALLLVLLLVPAGARAQSIPAPPVNTGAGEVQNLYAAGVTYNVGATPAIAGTGLYAHRMLEAGTYAFTAVDALPNTLKPFTVSTNVGAGVAQRIATIGKFPIYVPTAVGVSWNGGNTGWQWNAGALTSIAIKGNYRVLPCVRVLKSSVTGGTGYQPIIGVLFGWGQ